MGKCLPTVRFNFYQLSKTTRIEQWVATVEILGDINLVEVHYEAHDDKAHDDKVNHPSHYT